MCVHNRLQGFEWFSSMFTQTFLSQIDKFVGQKSSTIIISISGVLWNVGGRGGGVGQNIGTQLVFSKQIPQFFLLHYFRHDFYTNVQPICDCLSLFVLHIFNSWLVTVRYICRLKFSLLGITITVRIHSNLVWPLIYLFVYIIINLLKCCTNVRNGFVWFTNTPI